MTLRTFQNLSSSLCRLIIACAVISLATGAGALAQEVASPTAAARAIALENLVLTSSEVSGTVRNRTPDDLREIQLLIRYTWLWQDETKPGNIDPSTSAIYRVDRELKPGERENFSFKPTPPLSNITGGQFSITVSVFAFTAVKAVD